MLSTVSFSHHFIHYNHCQAVAFSEHTKHLINNRGKLYAYELRIMGYFRKCYPVKKVSFDIICNYSIHVVMDMVMDSYIESRNTKYAYYSHMFYKLNVF